MLDKANVLLVHGSWADASCWRLVIPELLQAGLGVQAVQLDMRSFEDDVETVERAATALGHNLVAGHSYGGAVISALDPSALDIRGLVYVAASAPEESQTLSSLMTAYPSEVTVKTVIDSAGYVWAADRDNFELAIGQDLDAETLDVLYATQRPIHIEIFEAKICDPAWRHVESRYLVAKQDHLFSPSTQRILGNKIGATTVEVNGGHMLPLSHPSNVAKTIIDFARSLERHSRNS
ncbi:alpha/beta hydrolase [Rhizobium sp. AB2/73]|uniref:alpha/beta fold hydrolase n=1 Tax=Rhizobium sp. AB2/73 TaxID=2795216 RepID=UPI000DDEB36B|nr:alpha/beta hydrolase [Rhizobium sp. AB2/73]QYA17444.1 alpha/beta hydrolase [Rhizobium sp. AB2/73]UEQ85765.1 alpha/beta hydrolase [Rhizobium sp. AB2/73]